MKELGFNNGRVPDNGNRESVVLGVSGCNDAEMTVFRVQVAQEI